ncbi:MAG: hypothetical protein J7M08_03875 [Planctomycetes bacterium]|nr:hypothetical protein [Planctomycetota bacterium]
MSAELAAVTSYRTYVQLLEAIGHTVDRSAVAAFLSDEDAQKRRLEQLLDQDETNFTPDADVTRRMEELVRSLQDEIKDLIEPEQDIEGEMAQALLKELGRVSQRKLDALADAVASNGHGKFTRPRYMKAGEFRQVLQECEESGGCFALFTLAPYLRRKLKKRGYTLSTEQILGLLRGQAGDQKAPYCLKHLLRELNGRFRAGLVPIEELVGESDADEWLEDARRKLLLRSHSAMHKAIAQVSSLKYDCIHKALSGNKKGRRIQVEIKDCLLKWLKDLEEGREPGIPEQYRAVSVKETCALLPELERRFKAKEDIYQIIAAKTGIKAGSVRRYFQKGGQLRSAPLAVYLCAKKLVEGRSEAKKRSYLSNDRIRRVAGRLAREARAALEQWRQADNAPELELRYRELRYNLIAAIKEGWQRIPSTLQ